MEARGFILQPSYRIIGGKPVVHLFGVLETGESFLVRDHSLTSHFWIRASDVERALGLGVTDIEASDATTLDGHPASRVEVKTPPDTPPVRDLLSDHGVMTYEADVRFAMRFLIDRGIRGSVLIDGTAERGQRGIRFDDPILAPDDFTPDLRALSIDIETDTKAQRLLSIALVGCGAADVLLFCPDGYPPAEGALPFADEKALLEGFVERLRELDPDVITGWNVVDFDLDVLHRLARRLGVALSLGRDGGRLRMRPSRAAWSTQEASIPGRIVLDGIHLVRGAFLKMESYGLDAVAKEVLGTGKTMTGSDRGHDIMQAFLHDRPRFVTYNRTDAQLVLDILDKLHLIELAVERARLTGLPLDRISGSIAAFDFLYLESLHRRGIVAPSVRDAPRMIGATGDEVNLGGHVFEPRPGLYRNVLVFDFKSLYPSVIRTFHIDPVGFIDDRGDGDHPTRDEALVAPNGARFRRQRGILTEILDALFPRREAAKAAGDTVASQAIKILMNSFYGVLGTSACRFYRPQLAGAITAFGRTILHWTKKRFEQDGHEVLYGDTDSLFVRLAETRENAEQTLRAGARVGRAIEADLTAWIERTWGTESRLELELETCYSRLLLHATRGGEGGARKRYAGLVGEGDRARVVFTGMEVVRSDWTELAKEVQRQLYERLFHDRPVEDYLRRTVAALRNGDLDHSLVYRKSLRKPLGAYTATTPPHVAAARKLPKPPRRRIRYVMTVAGPEPVELQPNAIDHEHYVAKQVRPVAEPVLDVLGLDFDRVIGDDTQMTLFD